MSGWAFGWRTLVLALVHIVAWMVGAAVFPVPLPGEVLPDPAASLGAMGVVCVVHSLLLGGLIRASGATGWTLWAAVFLIFWGPGTFMSQIEVAFFAPATMRPGTAWQVFGMGTVTACAVVPAALGLFGKGRVERAPRPLDKPGLRITAAALIYPPIYLVFGYYVALRQPAVQAFYGIDDPGSFTAQLGHLWTHDPLLFPFQILRGLLWVALTWPLLRQLRGPLAARAVWIGTALATFMNAQHLLPNPLMPSNVSLIHFVETWPSNFLYGGLIAMLLTGGAPEPGERA